MLRFLTFIICFFSFVNFAYAENWIEVHNGNHNAYIDADSVIKRENGSIYYNLRYFDVIKNKEYVTTLEYSNGKLGAVQNATYKKYLENPQICSTKNYKSATNFFDIESSWFKNVNQTALDCLNKDNMKNKTKETLATQKSKDEINTKKSLKNKELSERIKKSKTQTKYTPDFAHFMNRLQNKIKSNWNPPNSTSFQKVVILFKLNKEGMLLKNEIYQSSGNKKYDEAAINAIKESTPFDSFKDIIPNEETIDILFTFDYNVLED